MDTPTLYVHVADDGGILAVDSPTGRSRWVRLPELQQMLAHLREAGGSVLVSSERGSVIASPALAAIVNAGMQVVRSPEVHPDARREGGATSLMAMSYAGAAELVSDLVERGADLEARDDDGFTALMYAANAGHGHVVDLLVRAGAEVNQRDREGSTPLMFAAQHGDLRVVKKLLAAGADVAARRPDGLTAHDFAARNDHARVASVIMSAGSLRE
jgi:Ankyrin repeats (many copies)